jgi:hypothetical protein
MRSNIYDFKRNKKIDIRQQFNENVKTKKPLLLSNI